jgi:outer membrane protein assembly factor BamA
LWAVGKNNSYQMLRIVLPILFVMLVAGCNTTKYIPDDRYLLSGNEVKIDNREIDKEELKTYIRQKENLRILRMFKFHLWLYNLSPKGKEQGWIKRIGEPPVIYDEGLKNKSVQQLEQYLFNKGYYHAVVTDTVLLKQKKAKVVYQIETGEPYYIREVKHMINDSLLSPLIMQIMSETLLKQGDIFDVDLLQKERGRISTFLRNEGYFRFAEEFIHYKVDTTQAPKLVDIEMIVEKANVSMEMNNENHTRYFITGYSVYIDDPRAELIQTSNKAYADTTFAEGFTFYHNGPIPIKHSVLMKAFEIDPGSVYVRRKEERTYNNLYALRQFKFVNIQFQSEGIDADSLKGYLHGRVFLPLQTLQNYSVDFEGTNTSGNLGVAGNINYQHRNLLGGAEIFDFNIKGATERQVAFIDDENREFNTVEYGGTGRLTIPGFLFPIEIRSLNFFTTPFTSFSATYNFQNRPDYTRTIVNTTYGYRWKSSALFSHQVNFVDLNAVRIFSLNPTFIDQIKDLYIKSSYTDHIISASSYSLTYNSQGVLRRPDYKYFRMNFESAGNLLWGINNALESEMVAPSDPNVADQSPYFQIFDTRYAQYIKGDFDFRYGYRFDKYNSIASRAFAGLAFPYGNFNVMPFERRYFTGGANGIRAWQVRSLGPGSYAAGPGEYPNQSSDIKLEANIEYRFKLFWMLEGALFVDGGNIWAINQLDNRLGAVFNFADFYKEFALGTGLGVRMVSSYFIIRADIGLKLRDPSLPDGARWIPQSRSYNTSDLNFNIAIGYPF